MLFVFRTSRMKYVSTGLIHHRNEGYFPFTHIVQWSKRSVEVAVGGDTVVVGGGSRRVRFGHYRIAFRPSERRDAVHTWFVISVSRAIIELREEHKKKIRRTKTRGEE